MKRLAPLMLLALAACGSPAAKPSQATKVEVTDAWCRATPNGAPTGGCFVTLTSIGGDDRLVRVSTDRAQTAQIHEMSMDGGVMKMAELPGGLPLPDGRPQALAPGGDHIMLVGLNGPLVAGETVSLALTFEHAPEMGVRAQVRAIGATSGADHTAR
ncbi:MAG: copper chaperone PCu(A)C [Brevundimonas sp.]|nr:MAG: copper chaperone PCu(A)C [Brevundimonas sp.]